MNFMRMADGLAHTVYQFIVLSILWFMLDLPYAALMMMVSYAKTPDEIKSITLLAVALIPFVLSPALVVVDRVIRRFRAEPEGVPTKLIPFICSSYRQNYWASCAVGAVYAVMIGLIANAALVYGAQFAILFWVYALFFGLTAFSYLMSLAFVAGRNETFGQYLKNGLLVTLGNPLKAVLGIGLVGAAVYLTFHSTFFPIVFFFLPAVIGKFAQAVYQHTIAKLIDIKEAN